MSNEDKLTELHNLTGNMVALSNLRSSVNTSADFRDDERELFREFLIEREVDAWTAIGAIIRSLEAEYGDHS